MNLSSYLQIITSGINLSYKEASELSTSLIKTELNPIQVSALLTALKTKGESFEEISGFAQGLKNNAIHFETKRCDFYDIVGTGGDGADTFNISTTSAFVLSGAGLNIAKHGNRSISSKCGSADVLQELGVNINSSPSALQEQLDELGLAFIFAPLAHPSMKNVMSVRKNLGMATIFNIVGPLANPIPLKGQMIGVYSPSLVDKMANSMIQLGILNGVVVHGAGGLDEASLAGENTLAFVNNGLIKKLKVSACDYGLSPAPIASLKGGDAKENAKILKAILDGAKGPKRDVVLLNCGISLYAFGKVSDIAEGIDAATKSIDDGDAREQLNALIEMSQRRGA